MSRRVSSRASRTPFLKSASSRTTSARVAGEEPLEHLRLEDEIGEHLRRAVVHVPGDAHPLLLDDLEDLPRRAPEPCDPVGRAAHIEIGELVERPESSAELLEPLVDGVEPGAELAEPLVDDGELGALVGGEAEGVLDVVGLETGDVVEDVTADHGRLLEPLAEQDPLALGVRDPTLAVGCLGTEIGDQLSDEVAGVAQWRGADRLVGLRGVHGGDLHARRSRVTRK